MKRIPIIVAAVVVVILVRLRVRRRGRSPSLPFGRLSALRRDRHVFGDTGLVAGREIRDRLRSRVFRGVTVILFVLVAAAVVIPAIHGGTTEKRRVGVVAGSASLSAELQDLARSAGLTVQLVTEPDMSRARAALTSGRLDMVVNGTTELLLVENPVSASDTSAGARFVRDVSLSLGEQRAFAQAHLNARQAAIVAGAEPLPIESVKPAKTARTTSEATALLGVILIFIVLTQYLTWTLMGVMEEKSSRVVEVLLATVRPIQLLAGKVIGIGAIALAQSLALLAFALALAAATGSSLVHGTAPLVLVAAAVWLVLGYAFYSWVYAAAGSLAERQDQVQSLALPLSAPLILGYIVSLIGVSSGSASLLVKVLAYLPPTAPFAMPVLVGFGDATWWQFLLSAVACLACTVVVARLAGWIYRAAILQTGGRIRLRQLLPASTE